jgi:hypothetical protein
VNPAPASNGGVPGPIRESARAIVAIDKGLTTDDRVIINGLQKSRPGSPVAPEIWELRAPAAK